MAWELYRDEDTNQVALLNDLHNFDLGTNDNDPMLLNKRLALQESLFRLAEQKTSPEYVLAYREYIKDRGFKTAVKRVAVWLMMNGVDRDEVIGRISLFFSKNQASRIT